MQEQLIQYVKGHPEVESVYFNEAGTEYTLQVDKNHPIVKTRDEILKAKADNNNKKTDK